MDQSGRSRLAREPGRAQAEVTTCEPPHILHLYGRVPGVAHWPCKPKQRTPGSVKVRTGGYSPRPGRFQRPVDQVKFLDRRLKSGWEAVRGGRAFVRVAVPVRPWGEPCPASYPMSCSFILSSSTAPE